MHEFFGYPHVPHLVWIGDKEPRDDKVLSAREAEGLLANAVVIEEKIDGANLGFSLGPDGSLRAQNRGQYLHEPFARQFSRLNSWLMTHGEALQFSLTPNLIVFGEWCAARHSLDYDALPDWWLVFDVYDREAAKFWSSTRRDDWASCAGLQPIASVNRGRFTLQQLTSLLDRSQSQYRHGLMEGIVIRAEQGDWLRDRAKLVRPDFTQSIDTHWRKRPIQWNQLKA